MEELKEVATVSSTVSTEIAAILTVVAVAVLKKFHEWIKGRIDKKKYSDDDRLTKKHIMVDDFAVEVRTHLNADNVSVYRMHNGNKYAGNDCIKYLSMYTEKFEEFVECRKEKSQRMLSDNFSRTLQKMHQNKGIYVFHYDDVDDWHMKKSMSEQKFCTFIGIILYGPGNSWIGVVTINWRHTEIPKETVDIELISKFQSEFQFRLSQ